MFQVLKTSLLVLLVSIVPATSLAVAVPGNVGAVDVLPFCKNTPNAEQTKVCQAKSSDDGTNPVIKVMRTALQIMTVILGVMATIVVIVSGLKYITAGGDTSAIESARRSLTYALVGLVIAALAQILVSFVLEKL
jgi:hypothetical protein